MSGEASLFEFNYLLWPMKSIFKSSIDNYGDSQTLRIKEYI